MAKHKVEATITLTFDTEVDTDDLDQFTENDSDLDAEDSDAVHDVLMDIYHDPDLLIEVLNNESFLVDKVKIEVTHSKEKKGQ